MKLIKIVLIALFVLAAASTYGLFFTRLPILAAQRLLVSAGIEMTGATGSLMSGIHVDRLSLVGDDRDRFILENFDFAYSGIRNLFDRREFTISSISVGSLRVKVSESKSSSDLARKEEHSGPGSTPGRMVRINKLRIANVLVEHPNLSTPFEMENFEVDSITVTDGKFDFATLSIKSRPLDLDIRSGSVTALLKQELSSRIKQPIAFQGAYFPGEGDVDKTKFRAAAFNKMLQVQLGNTKIFALRAEGLSLSDFLVDVPPIERMNLGVEFASARSVDWTAGPGEFYLGSTKFMVPARSPVFVGEAGTKKAVLRIEGTGMTTDGLRVTVRAGIKTDEEGKFSRQDHKGEAFLEVVSVPALKRDEVLARVLYGRKPAALKQAEKNEVTRVTSFFRATADVLGP
jgi:hypothetical protein